MCGIAGVVPRETLPATVPERILERMLPRGPNDHGWARFEGAPRPALGRDWDGATLERPTFLHRRLSIIDLTKAGWQPMVSLDGRFTIVYNGEVYNHVELRHELEALGHTFHSHSDTEVLLEAYAEWGAAALPRLVGMFAFALHDRDRNEMFLARDFFGIKPLHWTLAPQGFAFASDLPTLLEVPWTSRVADPVTVHEYLTTDGGRTSAGPRTFLRGVQQLPAAHHLTVPLDLPTAPPVPVRYWHRPPPDKPAQIPYEDAVAEVRRLFLHNVRLHLRSDVPVGAALSGGIDSSAIVCAMRHLEGDRARIHTFTYVADDERLSEETWADRAIDAAGATAHKIRPARSDLVRDLPALVRAQGEPFGSTSIYAQYRVFQAAQKAGIRVMLDGQGADELLAGYRYFYPVRLGWLLRRGRLLEAHRTFQGMRRQPGVKAASLVAQAAVAALPRTARRLLRRLRLIDRRLTPKGIDLAWFRARGVHAQRPDRSVARDSLRTALHDAVSERSLPPLLRYEDRNSMAWSVESRVPFLTPDLATYLLALPPEYLLSPDGTTKRVLRDALKGMVPEPILERRDKVGFTTTEKEWLSEAPKWVEETLRRSTERLPFVRAETLLDTWKHIQTGQKAYDGLLFRTLNLGIWSETFDIRFD